MASSNVKFGPYVFPKRSYNALLDWGIDPKKPQQLDKLSLTELRNIPGFGDGSVQEVRKVRRNRLDEDEGDLDLGFEQEGEEAEFLMNTMIDGKPYVTNPGTQREPLSLTVTLTEGEDGIKRDHILYIGRILEYTPDPRNGQLFAGPEAFMAFLLRNTYGQDATRGGLRGVPKKDGPPEQGDRGAVQKDFTARITGPVPTTHNG